MLDNEDLKWITTKATELNAMLQQISRYSDLARQHKGEYNYIEMLGERVELASKTAQSVFDRVTSKIIAGSTGRSGGDSGASRAPAFTVFRPRPAPVSEPPTAKSNLLFRDKLFEEKVSESKEPEKKGPANIPAISVGALSGGKTIRNPAGNRDLILLVEDEAVIAEFAAEMLAEEGYKVIVAKDGFEALEIYQRIGKTVGLVILDFFLPIIDGDVVFDELRALNPKIDVVLSSGFAEQSKLGIMLGQGLRGFIPKPYTRERLLEQVRSTLDSTR